MKIALVSLVLAVALVALVWVGIRSGSVPVLKLQDLVSGQYEGGVVHVDDGRVVAVESMAPLKFSVAPDQSPSTVMRVTTPRSVPENFRLGSQVGLWGEYDGAAGVFRASRISTKCPSKYEAAASGNPGGDGMPAGRGAGGEGSGDVLSGSGGRGGRQ